MDDKKVTITAPGTARSEGSTHWCPRFAMQGKKSYAGTGAAR